ncbi:hypothetical protein J6590_017067 [Homalodisca vitripennis]|nr:hypothetical protein J6590_017067 [Homalodisca vitripennis]
MDDDDRCIVKWKTVIAGPQWYKTSVKSYINSSCFPTAPSPPHYYIPHKLLPQMAFFTSIYT